jgi:hypothetical protein
MNKDKAIQLLERLQDPEPYEPMLTKDAYDAIQMAIDALSADGDTISRTSLMSELKDMHNEAEKWIADAKNDDVKARAESCLVTITEIKLRVDKLPPAQPEQLEQCPIYGGMCAYPSNQCYDCPRHAGAKMEVTT